MNEEKDIEHGRTLPRLGAKIKTKEMLEPSDRCEREHGKWGLF